MTNQITITLDSSDLVFEHSGELVTTSKLVSQVFGKQHKDVLKKIDSLGCSAKFASANFCAHDELINAGAVKRKSKYYEITKDGFMLLVMGFTGQKAMGIKEAYINAFNKMADQLRSTLPTLPPQTAIAIPHNYLPNFYDSGWLPALFKRCPAESHWTYHIKFAVRPIGGKFKAVFELGVGGKGKAQPYFSSSSSGLVDSNFLLEYRNLDELWENIGKVLNKYGANSPFSVSSPNL